MHILPAPKLDLQSHLGGLGGTGASIVGVLSSTYPVLRVEMDGLWSETIKWGHPGGSKVGRWAI